MSLSQNIVNPLGELSLDFNLAAAYEKLSALPVVSPTIVFCHFDEAERAKEDHRDGKCDVYER